MNSKTQVVLPHKFSSRRITMGKTLKNDKISISYNRKPFYLNTGEVECLSGIEYIEGNTYGIIELQIPESCELYDVLDELDNIVKVIGNRRSEEIFGGKIDVEKVPTYPLLKNGILRLFIEYRNGYPAIPIFDRDQDRLTEVSSEIANRFTALFLINFRGLSIHDGHLKWDYRVTQFKINQSCKLPPGCLISDDEAFIEHQLKLRRLADPEIPEFDIVEEDNDDVNELLCDDM